jgi:hypothetical protein
MITSMRAENIAACRSSSLLRQAFQAWSKKALTTMVMRHGSSCWLCVGGAGAVPESNESEIEGSVAMLDDEADDASHDRNEDAAAVAKEARDEEVSWLARTLSARVLSASEVTLG